jgi:hypothetical protein
MSKESQTKIRAIAKALISIAIITLLSPIILVGLFPQKYLVAPLNQLTPASTIKSIDEGVKKQGTIISPPREMGSGMKLYFVIQEDDQNMEISQCFSCEILTVGDMVGIHPITLTDANQIKTEIWFVKRIPPEK